jgi:hypothetical protein
MSIVTPSPQERFTQELRMLGKAPDLVFPLYIRETLIYVHDTLEMARHMACSALNKEELDPQVYLAVYDRINQERLRRVHNALEEEDCDDDHEEELEPLPSE